MHTLDPLHPILGVVAAAALVAACQSPATIEGVWSLESFMVDDAEVQVEIGINSRYPPWVEFGEVLSGTFGCNDFIQVIDYGYRYTDGTVVPGEVIAIRTHCTPDDVPELLAAERALLAIMREHPSGIDVEFRDGGIVWTAGEHRLFFLPADQTRTRSPFGS